MHSAEGGRGVEFLSTFCFLFIPSSFHSLAVHLYHSVLSQALRERSQQSLSLILERTDGEKADSDCGGRLRGHMS